MASTTRAGSAHPVRLTCRLQDGRSVVVSELTAAGMQVETGTGLQLGQELVLELRAPGSPLVFTAHGVVVRLHGAQRGAAHVRFTDVRMRRAR